MTDPGSITRLLLDTADGDDAAATAIWDRFKHRLAALAKSRLAGTRTAVSDEDDVAIEAFHSLLLGMRSGRYQIPSRDDMWRLLACMAIRRAQTVYRRQHSQKRAGEVGESALKVGDLDEIGGIAGVADDQPDPTTVAEVNLILSELDGLLTEDNERDILLLKLEGYSHREVAERLGLGLWRVRKVVDRIERYLRR